MVATLQIKGFGAISQCSTLASNILSLSTRASSARVQASQRTSNCSLYAGYVRLVPQSVATFFSITENSSVLVSDGSEEDTAFVNQSGNFSSFLRFR